MHKSLQSVKDSLSCLRLAFPNHNKLAGRNTYGLKRRGAPHLEVGKTTLEKRSSNAVQRLTKRAVVVDRHGRRPLRRNARCFRHLHMYPSIIKHRLHCEGIKPHAVSTLGIPMLHYIPGDDFPWRGIAVDLQYS
jgi:hypothetical protein